MYHFNREPQILESEGPDANAKTTSIVHADMHPRGRAWHARAAGGRQAAPAAPISLHPANPHYFLLRGKPAVLITSGEHYGAVLNLDFDYGKYLDALAADGLNYTRTFSGAYVEPQARSTSRAIRWRRARPVHLPVGRAATSRATRTAATSSTLALGRRLLRAAEGLRRAGREAAASSSR